MPNRLLRLQDAQLDYTLLRQQDAQLDYTLLRQQDEQSTTGYCKIDGKLCFTSYLRASISDDCRPRRAVFA